MDNYEITVANEGEKQQAADLIGEVYERSGYVGEHQLRPGVSEYLFSPHTTTFVAKKGDGIEGTLSVFHDADRRLPMDVIFGQELNELRASHVKIVEVGQFAVAERKGIVGISLALGPSLALFRRVLTYCIEEHIDVICIAVNPKHERFYHLLGFKRWPEEKSYPSVNNAPAIGMRLYVETLKSIKPTGLLARKLLGI